MSLKQHINKKKDPNAQIKVGIWVFFYLLIFEGALRKWVLPFLSTPLLLVRDPVTIWILLKAIQKQVLPFNAYVYIMCSIGIISIFTAVFFGHGNLIVGIYGARTWFLYFPLMYVIGAVFTREDVLIFARRYLWLSIPMTILITLQFYSPQSAWVNRGVGGNEAGAGFEGAMGFFRPPGTFSFATGVGQFYSALACFVFYYWINSKGVSRTLLIAASISLLIAIPISIIRGLFFQVGVILIFMLFAAFRKPKLVLQVVTAIIGVTFVILLLSQLSFFSTATDAFMARFTSANQNEGGVEGVVGNRYFGDMFHAFALANNQPFWGYGSGVGTNVGGMLLNGKQSFYSSIDGEVEWQRVIGELGILMGTIVILIRLALCITLTTDAYKRLTINDFLPWMILPYCLLNIPQGTWGVPTPLGFNILIGGIMLAALNFKRDTKLPIISYAETWLS